MKSNLFRPGSFLDQYWVLLLFILVKFTLQFTLVNPVYELHRDEYLHLDQAFHPAAGYISVPPFTSWIAHIIYLLGGGLLWIRFFPALFGVLTLVFAWLIADEAGGRLPAKILTAVFLVFSVFTRLNVLLQPNSFDILVWTGLFWLMIRYVRTHQPKWLIWMALWTALGLYNKYNIVFLVAGLFAGLLLTRERSIFTRKHFFYALTISILLVFPNILWQIQNHFPVIHHMKALNDNQLVNTGRIDFLTEQLKMGLIGILTLAALWGFIFYPPFKPFRFIGWTFITVITLYMLGRAKNYYALGLYPALFALGSVYFEYLFKRNTILGVVLLSTLNIGIFLAIVPYMMPVRSPAEIVAHREPYEKLGLLRWEDGKNHLLPQDFSDMTGWKEMADKALAAWHMIPPGEQPNTLIICYNYGQSGALNYYNRHQMPEAYSFNTDYIYWMPRIKEIKNVVLIGDRPHQDLIDGFTEFKRTGTVENEYSREKGTGIFLFLGSKPEFTERFYKTVEERKRDFRIF